MMNNRAFFPALTVTIRHDFCVGTCMAKLEKSFGARPPLPGLLSTRNGAGYGWV
jgi:hypothetical protein